MANINKPALVKQQIGLPSKLDIVSGMDGIQQAPIMASGPDNVPAMIQDHMGNVKSPAALKEGEIVFSVEAVIGAGNGDYEHGKEVLLEVHNQLQALGKQFLGEQGSLANAEME